MLDILREYRGVQPARRGCDLAVRPVDTTRQPKLTVQVQGGQAISLTGNCHVEGLQKGLDQRLLVSIASARKQFGGYKRIDLSETKSQQPGHVGSQSESSCQTIRRP